MPRQKVNRNQRTIDDIVIEDPALADALQYVAANVDAAKELRSARQNVKTLIQTEHRDVIDAVLDNGKARWIVCDNFRFTYQTRERPAGKKPAPAGVATTIEIYKLES